MRSGHILIGDEGRLLSTDQGFNTIMQSDPALLLGRPVLDITAPADREECGRALVKLRQSRQPFEISKRFIRDDGTLVWVRNTVSMVDDGRNSELVVATITPVTPPSARAPALLLDVARLLITLNEGRTAIFDSSLFSDTAWEAILAAYIAEAEGKAITVCALAMQLAIPIERARRWIAVLVSHGAIEIETRETDPEAPKSFRLTTKAHKRLERHLAAAGKLQAALRVPSDA